MRRGICGISLLLVLIISETVVAVSALRDPTRPFGYRSGPSGVKTEQVVEKVVLNGIFRSPTGYSAIVNGRRVTKGDRVAGRRVIAISGNRVIFDLEGEQEIIQLHATGMKQRISKQNGGKR